MSEDEEIRPDYYKRAGVECIWISRYYLSDWGQCIQYVFRHRGKNGVADLRKALHFALDAMAKDQPCKPMPDTFRTARKVTPLLNILAKDSTGAEKTFWESVSLDDEERLLGALFDLIREEEEEKRPMGEMQPGYDTSPKDPQ